MRACTQYLQFEVDLHVLVDAQRNAHRSAQIGGARVVHERLALKQIVGEQRDEFHHRVVGRANHDIETCGARAESDRDHGATRENQKMRKTRSKKTVLKNQIASQYMDSVCAFELAENKSAK